MRRRMVVLSLALLVLLSLSLFVILPSSRGQEVLLGFDTELVDTPETVTDVLGALDRQNATATFFVTGSFVQAHPDLTRAIAQKHEVACHTMTHPRMPELDDEARTDELVTCRRVVENITGKAVSGFRAPYNRLDARTATMLGPAGYAYDASSFEGFRFFYPKTSVLELPISTFYLLPMEDYPLVKVLRLGDAAFWLMGRERAERVSLAFHPRIVAEHPDAFDELLAHYAERNATFRTHASAIAHSSP